ncbi:protein LONGIFOLIA 1-like isoform X1 [Trifolium pratense]|uniref:protein LONGIFOLIA 1-like isoform X1 n=1 Tax=Trifolium pratense TaxID=57577 RepID=UPI001E69614E|nr:protein LONGIFOLIA 1-like isoform X1 [Trifolium pratense]XP_045794457.1 protein LONGIFOLIA 1-like isoform X1 [Trifolium pratense]XP_045794458.1 protein LONGIFOLIA 1-like isoform X1 [Trifolium pratense]
MSGKGLKSMKDEKQDLQKQIGCITGFFQLFDRHRFITGQQSSRYIQNASSSGVTNNCTKELNSTIQKPKAKNQNNAKEKQQFSTESSITSVSSSCSSSLSSIEFNAIIKTKSPSTKPIQIPKKPHSRQQSLDFCDIVKDSMHREAKGLYVNTLTKEEKNGQAYALNRHIDSPRPMLSQNFVNARVTASNEPLHTLSRSKKSHWDSPRLSYDALKSTTRNKELPRFSLDSKQGSIRGIEGGNKARNLLNGAQRGYERNSSAMLNKLQEPETSRRSTSVVAKLMGLEVLPDSTQTCQTSICSVDKKELMERTSISGESKKHQSSVSPRNRRGDDSITNVKPCSQFALEPTTPWRQPDAGQSSLLQDSSKGSDSDIKASKPSLSVYGEIEQRLTELEFKKSGKDLRALKHILEAMQRFTDSSSDTRNNNTSVCENSKVQSPRIQQKDSRSETTTVELSNSIKGSKSPIVIVKPTKVTRKANNPASTELSINDKSCISKCSSTNGRLVDKQKVKGIVSTTKNTKDPFGQNVPSKLMQSSKSFQESNQKNTINSGSITETESPRLQKKFGFERRSPPTSPSSDSTINRRQYNRQQKFSILQDGDEHFSDMRNFKHRVNVIFENFDSNRSLDARSDIEVIRIDQSANINQNNAFEEVSQESSEADKIVTAEQPSPVSVLDAAFYKEDPPSPVKKQSSVSKYLGEALSTDDSEENTVAQILQEIDQIDEELIDFDNIKNPDHKYISEILIASGLVSDRNSNQILHSHGHLINPKLFFALEQVKTNKVHFNIKDDAEKIHRAFSSEKMQRKLIFDVVTDMLVNKLIYQTSSRKLKGKRLFEELCTEIDELQPPNMNDSNVHEDENLTSLLCRDLKNNNTIWTNCGSEKPNIVLDIERSIFKDLITEVCDR